MLEGVDFLTITDIWLSVPLEIDDYCSAYYLIQRTAKPDYFSGGVSLFYNNSRPRLLPPALMGGNLITFNGPINQSRSRLRPPAEKGLHFRHGRQGFNSLLGGKTPGTSSWGL